MAYDGCLREFDEDAKQHRCEERLEQALRAEGKYSKKNEDREAPKMCDLRNRACEGIQGVPEINLERVSASRSTDGGEEA